MTEDANRKCKTCRWWDPDCREPNLAMPEVQWWWGVCNATDSEHMEVMSEAGCWAVLETREDFWCKCWEAQP